MCSQEWQFLASEVYEKFIATISGPKNLGGRRGGSYTMHSEKVSWRHQWSICYIEIWTDSRLL